MAQATEHVSRHVFGDGDDPDCDLCDRNGVGIELEFLTGTAGFARLGVDHAEALMADVAPLPAASRLTLEPGGQLELSTACLPTLETACEAAANDLYRLDQVCAGAGVDLVALGADPLRRPERIVTAQRYRAMEAYFDATGPAGRTMMCNTASIQINLGLGQPCETVDRWRLANAVGPVLIACFANSPFSRRSPTGWQSSRLRAWWALDPSRSKPVPTTGDPAARWLEYALDARVMLIRDGDTYQSLPQPLTFGQWLAEGHELGWPTLDDWAYHLTTLFPPVRPKGWFELRMCDALPTPFWYVAVAVAHALLMEPAVVDEVEHAVDGATDLWVDAAQLGLAHPALATAGRRCFELALRVLEERGSPTVDVVAGYHDRWVAQGRSPADDRHDVWRRTGELLPSRESPVPYHRELALRGPRS
jgi:glutamate--cysteine ligase